MPSTRPMPNWGNSDDVIGVPFLDSLSLEVAWTDYLSIPLKVDVMRPLLAQ